MNRDHHEAEPAREGGLSPASPQPRDLCTDANHDWFDIGHHVCHIEPKHVIPGRNESPIAPLIKPLASTVVEPIDFDDELHLGSEQIDDEPTEQRDVPPKRDACPAAAESLKEHLLGSGGGATHDCLALIELRAPGLGNGRDVEHGILLVPSRGAGRERPRRTIRDVRQQADASTARSNARTVRHEAVDAPTGLASPVHRPQIRTRSLRELRADGGGASWLRRWSSRSFQVARGAAGATNDTP